METRSCSNYAVLKTSSSQCKTLLKEGGKYTSAGKFAPEKTETLNLIDGEIAGFQITQGIMLVFMILMIIPSLMVFLSLALKAKANRWINIIVGILQTGLVIVSGIESSNSYFTFASSVEAVLLLLIVWYAWKWPIQET